MKALLADLYKVIETYLAYGLHGGFGAGANYLYHHANKGKPFNVKGLLIFIVLGAVTTNMIGPPIPSDLPGRDGMLVAIGFMFWPILSALDAKGSAIAERFTGLFGK